MSINPQIQNMVTEFKNRTGAPAFPKLRRAEVARDLLVRVDAPETIDQGSSSLCGPAAFLFNLLKINAMAYAKYVIDLYEKGDAWIGHMHVVPSAACKASSGAGLMAVDWIALASLRDAKNKALTYSSAADEVAGITIPANVTSWFQSCGYFKSTTNDTNLLYFKDVWNLKDARNHWQGGSWPCLFINAGMLGSGSPSVPNHWVVLHSEVLIDDKPIAGYNPSTVLYTKTTSSTISFRVFTWGGLRTVRMPVKSFVQYYYGYVVAK